MKPEEDDSSVRSTSPNMHNSLIQNDLNGDADDLSDDNDSDNLEDNDLLAVACQDEITAQLAAAGMFKILYYFLIFLKSIFVDYILFRFRYIKI